MHSSARQDIYLNFNTCPNSCNHHPQKWYKRISTPQGIPWCWTCAVNLWQLLICSLFCFVGYHVKPDSMWFFLRPALVSVEKLPKCTSSWDVINKLQRVHTVILLSLEWNRSLYANVLRSPRHAVRMKSSGCRNNTYSEVSCVSNHIYVNAQV